MFNRFRINFARATFLLNSRACIVAAFFGALTPSTHAIEVLTENELLTHGKYSGTVPMRANGKHPTRHLHGFIHDVNSPTRETFYNSLHENSFCDDE